MNRGLCHTFCKHKYVWFTNKLSLFQLKRMEEVTKKVASGKINHKNSIKSCQLSYSAKKKLQRGRVLVLLLVDWPSIPRQNNGWKTPIFGTRCFLTTSKGSMKFLKKCIFTWWASHMFKKVKCSNYYHGLAKWTYSIHF